MNLEYTHKPDYYLFAQLLVRHIESYIHKHPDADNAILTCEMSMKFLGKISHQPQQT